MEKKIPSWKTLFQITEVLELAALRKDARSHNRLYGSLTFSQSRVCVALIRLLEKQPSGVSLKELAAELKISPGATSELVEEDCALPRPTRPRSWWRSLSGKESSPEHKMRTTAVRSPSGFSTM